MINPNLILPECFVDTLFMNMVLKNMHEEGMANHQPSIGGVANLMQKKFSTRNALGLIDDDRQKPNYFNAFDLVDEQGGLLFKKHNTNLHYLIVISPVFEHWAFDTAKKLGIRHKFSTIKQLKNVCKKANADKNPALKNLINSLIQKKGSPVGKMQTWIKEVFLK